MQSKIWAVIPAAGGGSRFGGDVPKQYLTLDGKFLLLHSLETLLANPDIHQVSIALSEDDRQFTGIESSLSTDRVCRVVGGPSRAKSVLNAIESLRKKIDDNDFVLVHDAARPLLHPNDLQSLIDAVIEQGVGGILAEPVVDTLKRVESDEGRPAGYSIRETVSRNNIWAAQTPQMFRFDILYPALKAALDPDDSQSAQSTQTTNEITDEASACEFAGYTPLLIPARYPNFKITHPADLSMAELILQQRATNQ